MVRWIAILVASVCAYGQDLDRVVAEAKAVRATSVAEDYTEALKDLRQRSLGFHAALRDWIELQLPASRPNSDAELALLQSRLESNLFQAGLTGHKDEPKPGDVAKVHFLLTPDVPDLLAVTVGVGVPCGSDDVAYIYDYGEGAPRRVLESHGTRDGDQNIGEIRFSKPDVDRSTLLLITRFSAQCASFWMGFSFDVFRYKAAAGSAVPVLGGEHGMYLDDDLHIRLNPDELLIELSDRSIDSDILIRKHVLHYRIGDCSAERIDPVALLPQDFVDEWLSRTWAEMESRSAEDNRELLQKWHNFLSASEGHFTLVQECAELP